MCAQAHLANPFAAAKMDTRLPGVAAHSSTCFLRFMGADNIPPFSIPAGVHDGARCLRTRGRRSSAAESRETQIGPLGERTSWPRGLPSRVGCGLLSSSAKRPNPVLRLLATRAPLLILVVHHPTPLQSRLGAHAGALLPLRDRRPRWRPAPIRPTALPQYPPVVPTDFVHHLRGRPQPSMLPRHLSFQQCKSS